MLPASDPAQDPIRPQAAAYFLYRAGEPLPVPKLMKLLYLAERRSFERFAEPMIGDRLVSMPHGPVLSITYNHMNGELPSIEGGWDTWIDARTENLLALRDSGAVGDPMRTLRDLCDADLDVLAETWDRFGAMDQWTLSDYTHTQCREWKDPDGSMIPVSPDELFSALNFSAEKTAAALARMREAEEIAGAFAGNEK